VSLKHTSRALIINNNLPQVMPDDTCAGVCLRYKLKASVLRSLNGFVSENIQMLKVRKY
jgi:hypothetical protein